MNDTQKVKQRICSRHVRIARMYFIKRLNQPQIARRLGITQQGVSWALLRVGRVAAALKLESVGVGQKISA